jgi:hypothetical protein
MDHESEPVLVRQRYLLRKRLSLLSTGRVVVVLVEPAFADGDHARSRHPRSGELAEVSVDSLHSLAGVVRV